MQLAADSQQVDPYPSVFEGMDILTFPRPVELHPLIRPPSFCISLSNPLISFILGNFISITLVSISRDRPCAGQEASNRVRP